MIDINFAGVDLEKILFYLESNGGECNVDDLFRLESIEKLRIYSLIYRLREVGVLEITDYADLGAPRRIKLV